MTDRPRHEELDETMSYDQREQRHLELEGRLAAEGWVRRGHRWAPSGLGEKCVVLWEKRNDGPGPLGWLQTHVPYHAGPSYEADCDQVLADMAHARGDTWGSSIRERNELLAKLAKLESERVEAVRIAIETARECARLLAEVERVKATPSEDGEVAS